MSVRALPARSIPSVTILPVRQHAVHEVAGGIRERLLRRIGRRQAHLTVHRETGVAAHPRDWCYDLQNTKRATIIGGGGAHPTMMRRLDHHFASGVPFARVPTK